MEVKLCGSETSAHTRRWISSIYGQVQPSSRTRAMRNRKLYDRAQLMKMNSRSMWRNVWRMRKLSHKSLAGAAAQMNCENAHLQLVTFQVALSGSAFGAWESETRASIKWHLWIETRDFPLVTIDAIVAARSIFLFVINFDTAESCATFRHDGTIEVTR